MKSAMRRASLQDTPPRLRAFSHAFHSTVAIPPLALPTGPAGAQTKLTLELKKVFLWPSTMDQLKPSLDALRIEREDRPARPARGGYLLLILFLLLILGGGAWWFTHPKAIPVRSYVARDAATGNPADRTVLNASGYVTARREATVSSKVTGKVIEVLVEEGVHVKEGQVLARLDDTNVRVSLEYAEAQLQSAMRSLEETRVRIREAEQELERQTGLMKNKIATQADYDHAEATALALKARLEQQQADVLVADRQVANWKQQLEDTIIRAPFAGIVTSKNAQPGEMISPISAGGGFTRTGICTIVDMQSLEIEIDVNESYINRVEPNQPIEATLDAYPDWKIPCKVIAIIPTADRQKSTVKVRVGFDKLDPRILPEMSIKVAFREATTSTPVVRRGVVVPKAAVQRQGDRDIVMVLQNNRAEHRAVTLASANGNEALITAGLSAGEKVALDWPTGLKEGALTKEIAP
jgi:HlyD family secretion protein